jgi:hypothetical protein
MYSTRATAWQHTYILMGHIQVNNDNNTTPIITKQNNTGKHGRCKKKLAHEKIKSNVLNKYERQKCNNIGIFKLNN